MQVVKLPKWVVKHIDRLRRSFLWKGNDKCSGISCLVGWGRVCTLKINGGMGVTDLLTQNEALLSKWIWKIQSQPEAHWSQVLRQLYGIHNTSSLSANCDRSYFTKVLTDNTHFIKCSTTVDGNGREIWRWTHHGQFTTASTYRRLQDSGVICLYQKHHLRLESSFDC